MLVLKAIWVLSPFITLMWANPVSKHWSRPARAALYTVMLAVPVGSLAIYGDDANRHRWAHAASVFVIVPGTSWLLMAIAVPTAIFISGRLSRAEKRAEPRRRHCMTSVFREGLKSHSPAERHIWARGGKRYD